MANDLRKIDSLIQALSEATILIAAAREFGTYRHETCPYEKDGFCPLETWASEDEIPQGIGEPVRLDDEELEWYIKPSPFYCAMCSASFEIRLDNIETEVSGNPLSGAKYEITCKACGSKGWLPPLLSSAASRFVSCPPSLEFASDSATL